MSTGVLSNTILDPSGTALSGVTVTARLKPYGGFRSDTATEVTSAEQTTSDSNGAWSLTLEYNSNITPAGTYWEVTEDIPAPGESRTYACSVSAASQTVLAALVSSLPTYSTGTYLTQASADARYQAVGSLGAGELRVASTSAAGTSSSAMRADARFMVGTHEFVTITNTALTLIAGRRVPYVGTATATLVTVKEGDLWFRPDIDALRYSVDGSTYGDVVSSLAGWHTFTPTLHQPATATLTTATAVGRYVRMGRIGILHVSIACAQAGTAGQSVEVGSIPTAAAPRSSGINTQDGDADVGSYVLVDTGTAFYNGSCGFRSATNIIFFSGGAPTSNLGVNPSYAVANADFLNATIVYELLA